MRFRDISIKRKLMVLLTVSSIATVFLASTAFIANDLLEARRVLSQDLSVLAEVVGSNSTAALAFQDRDSAEEILSALRAEKGVVLAGIYDSRDELFATYVREGIENSTFPGAPEKDGYSFEDGYLVVSKEIELDRSKVGTVFVMSDLEELYDHLQWYANIALVIVVASFFAAFGLSARLQRTVSDPVLNLAETAKLVSDKKDYSIRAVKAGNDELGTLVDGFNGMLDQIQNRDAELRETNRMLEMKMKQLMEAQEELLRQEKLAMLGQLSGSVGHELRNPLGVISNAVYFLQTVEAEADETVKEYLDIIKDEVTNSQRIVSDLLDFARTKTPQPQVISSRDLIEKSLQKCSIPENVTVKNELSATLPSIRVDPLQVSQVLLNIITNAAQAMPEGGSIEIRGAEANGGALAISVKDTGTGISPEDIEKMFQPLYTTKARGIGLGMTVSKNLTEANGGTIGVSSKLDEGTTVILTLPTSEGVA